VLQSKRKSGTSHRSPRIVLRHSYQTQIPPTEDWVPPTELSQGPGVYGGSEVHEGKPGVYGGSEVHKGKPGVYGGSEDVKEETQVKEVQSPVTGEEGEELSQGKDHRLRDARRMIRAVKKVAYDLLREERKARGEKKASEPKNKVYEVGLKHLEHRVGKREVYEVQVGAWHKFRKKLIQKFRLKGLRWNLWERDGIA
jgi:hypothetical protein